MLKSRKVSRRNVYYYAHLQRLRDAQALFEKRRWVGCIYMAEIAVECVLKYTVCVRENVIHLVEATPELLSKRGHDLRELLRRTGLQFAPKEYEMMRRFALLTSWDVGIRYESSDGSAKDAQQFLDAAVTFCQWVIQKRA